MREEVAAISKGIEIFATPMRFNPMPIGVALKLGIKR
jgi:hypothetical protein